MPIYEYVCSKCGLNFELRRSFGEVDKDANCPKCQGAAKRTFSVFTPASKDQHGVSRPVGRPWGYYEP